MFKKLKSIIIFILSISTIAFGQIEIFAESVNPLKIETEFGSIYVSDSFDSEICGFKKINTQFISDYQTNADIYEHIKTGAKVLVINNGDEEKFFTIGFRTPPVDDSGATHVFEHTTLQGSKKYPVKSMLTRLGSTSMATYFNAATADDFTFYPFGSLNEKDYYNLMNIYLDGIFYPMVIDDKNVFKRDGVRLDFKDNKISYNGVVFNEMKNSSSNINSILYNSIKKSLYPDTYYRYTSGGTPESIPDLTYEQIIQLYDRAYHPSNSLTVLYGNQDLRKSMEILNSYFKDYDMQQNKIEAAYQNPYTSLKKYYGSYPASSDSSNSIIALSYVIPDTDNYEDYMTYMILIDMLMSGDTSPLKKYISQSGITNSFGVTSNYMQINQGAISFYSMNIDSKYEDMFVNTIENALKQIKEDGFDADYINSIFNAYEYSQLNESNSKNRGYKAGLSAIAGWIYDNDITSRLDSKAICEKLKSDLSSEIFENAIDKLFLNNNFKSLTVIKPDIEYQSSQSQILNQKLSEYARNLTESQKAELSKQTEEFYKWQNTSDSQEAINLLPKLEVNDISNENKKIEVSSAIDIDGAKMIQTYIDTNGISNIVLSFDASTISQKDLQYLQLLGSMLGNAATKNYSKDELSEQKLNYIGDFYAGVESVTNFKDGSYSPRFNISLKALNSNEKAAIDILNDIIENSVLDDKQLVIKNLQQFKLYYERSLSELSVPLASYVAEAMATDSGKLRDYVDGYEFYNFVVDTLDTIDRDWNSVYKSLQRVKNMIFNKNNLVIGYTGLEDRQIEFKTNILDFVKSLSSKKYRTQKLEFKDYGNNIAIVSPTNTLSVNMVSNLKDLGYQYSGDMSVLSNIVSKGYLWEYIREQGGAYHTAMSIRCDGFLRLLSYADPNFIQTLKVYQNIALFLNNISNMKQNSVDSFIISAASNIDNSIQNYNMWNYGINSYLTGYDLDFIYSQKNQILNTKIEDISNYADMFEKLNSKAKYVIVGNKQIIDKNKDKFDTIIELDR